MATESTPAEAETGGAATEVFGREQDRLFGLAYRMTSSVMDAEDIVQEAWVRFDRLDLVELREPAAMLTTIVTRLAIDRCRSARAQRETYVGPWLPEPILTDRDPARVLEMDESIRLGFLHVLDRLGPVDRAVFLLHDVFGMSFAEIAPTVDRTEANCRQIARRARDRVRQERPAVTADVEHRRQLLETFLRALRTGDAKALEQKLADDVIVLSDGGAAVRAARNPVVGPHRVARFLTNLTKRVPDDASLEIVEANGEVAVAFVMGGEPHAVHEIEFRNGLLHRLHSVNNPDKLAAVRRAWAKGADPTVE